MHSQRAEIGNLENHLTAMIRVIGGRCTEGEQNTQQAQEDTQVAFEQQAEEIRALSNRMEGIW